MSSWWDSITSNAQLLVEVNVIAVSEMSVTLLHIISCHKIIICLFMFSILKMR